MKKKHISYKQVKVKCLSCGFVHDVFTTLDGNFTVPICSNCHPVYKGEIHAVVDTSNRISKFLSKQELSQKIREKVLSIKENKKQRTDKQRSRSSYSLSTGAG